MTIRKIHVLYICTANFFGKQCLKIKCDFCFSPNRQGRSELRSSGRSVSPSPIRYNSPGGLATHLSHKVTSKSSKEAASSSLTSSSGSAGTSANSGLRLSNLTPPGSRKYGTYSMGGNYERSDAASPNSSTSSCPSCPVTSKPIPLVVKTPPVTRKVGRASSPLSGKKKRTNKKKCQLGS